VIGGDTRQVLTLAQNWRDLPLSEGDRAMLAYVEVIALTPSTATAADVAGLRRVGFSDAEIFEIVMVTAYYALRCRMADGLGVEIDARAKQDGALVEAFAYRARPEGV
jgi:alkylhydroperoxidase family enzyme